MLSNSACTVSGVGTCARIFTRVVACVMSILGVGILPPVMASSIAAWSCLLIFPTLIPCLMVFSVWFASALVTVLLPISFVTFFMGRSFLVGLDCLFPVSRLVEQEFWGAIVIFTVEFLLFGFCLLRIVVPKAPLHRRAKNARQVLNSPANDSVPSRKWLIVSRLRAFP